MEQPMDIMVDGINYSILIRPHSLADYKWYTAYLKNDDSWIVLEYNFADMDLYFDDQTPHLLQAVSKEHLDNLVPIVKEYIKSYWTPWAYAYKNQKEDGKN